MSHQPLELGGCAPRAPIAARLAGARAVGLCSVPETGHKVASLGDRAELEAARRALGISMLDLWWKYFAIGGTGDAYALAAYLRGQATTDTTTHNMIVHALNETFTDRGQVSPVPYRGDEGFGSSA